VFDWFKSDKRIQRSKIKSDRKHLEARTRRFLKSYLAANEKQKIPFYRAVEDASKECQPAQLGPANSEREDAEIAESTSDAAMQIVLAHERRQGDPVPAFITDAYATVAVAYHRAAGLYVEEPELQQLGTAAVHLLTMATSYLRAAENDRVSSD
jgi:hypothetical protein